MTNINNIPLSVLDPSPITTGGSAEESLHNTLDLAKKAEQWGYKRFWLAEHHNWIGMASSANKLATPMYQKCLLLSRNQTATLQPPVDDMDALWSEQERKAVEEQLSTSIIGDRAGVKEQLEALIAQTEANEIMAHTEIFDHQARLRSYEILANTVKS